MAYTSPSEINAGASYTSGINYITIPYGCSSFTVRCWGAGGCGGGGNKANGKWGGGGGGGYTEVQTDFPPPGSLIRITVGDGGTSAGTNDGGPSTVEMSSQWDQESWTTIAIAEGGYGVPVNTLTGGNGGGGSADISFKGGNGGTGNATNAGGGGGGAGSLNSGVNGGNPTGGTGGSDGGGNGGNGRTGSVGPGLAGSTNGGGGGGAWTSTTTTYAGGNGAGGEVQIDIYYELNTMIIGSGM